MCKKIIFLLSLIGVVIIIIVISILVYNFLSNYNINFLSNYNINFTSPFEDGTPSQFVFLTCMVTSTLTLSVIGNRLRDRRDALYNEKGIKKFHLSQNEEWKKKFTTRLNISEPTLPSIDDRIKNCTAALDQINIIEWIQLAITFLISFRIVLNSFGLRCDLIDVVLVGGAFIVFGILWPLYFFSYGGGRKPFFFPQHWSRYWKK